MYELTQESHVPTMLRNHDRYRLPELEKAAYVICPETVRIRNMKFYRTAVNLTPLVRCYGCKKQRFWGSLARLMGHAHLEPGVFYI